MIRWFGKAKSGEVWEESRSWSRSATSRRPSASAASAGPPSAKQAAHLGLSGKRATQKKQKFESERYERAAKAAMEIALKMTDELMCDAAVREIIDLCLAANNDKTARILLRVIQTPSIGDMVLRDHPEMGLEMS